MTDPSPAAPLPPDRPGRPPPPRTRQPDATRIWALAAWAVPLLYFASLFHRRWIPFDEGTLGQAALRVLEGELPHRDFDAMYTGLGEVVNAGAMALAGVSLLTPRLVLLVAVALWIPALWAIARRLVASPAVAAGLVALALVLGPPNYPAAMPSWFNLFFATWGLWALLRWSEGGRAGWLVAAGALAGLSILWKVVGLYALAAALFFVLDRTVRDAGDDARGPLAWLAAAAVLALVALEVALVRSQAGPSAWVNYVLPTAALGAGTVAAAWRGAPPRVEADPSGRPPRLGDLAARWGWLFLGAAIPLVPFLAWYGAAGALDDLYRGVFVLPALRLDRAAIRTPPLLDTVGILVPLALLAVETRLPPRPRWILAGAVALLGGFVVTHLNVAVYLMLMGCLYLAVPVTCAVGAGVLARPDVARRDALLATLWTAALVHLVRYPFAGVIYFTYVAPLALLAVAGVVARARRGRAGAGRPAPGALPVTWALAALVLAFFVAGPNRGGLFGPLPPAPEAPLPMERGHLDVPVNEAVEYARLDEVVRTLARGDHILATPDAPEVYFLTGFDNPTRSLFEVFQDEDERTRTTLDAVSEANVNVVVLNTRSRFSSLPAELARALAERFPRATQVGRFVVRWRE